MKLYHGTNSEAVLNILETGSILSRDSHNGEKGTVSYDKIMFPNAIYLANNYKQAANYADMFGEGLGYNEDFNLHSVVLEIEVNLNDENTNADEDVFKENMIPNDEWYQFMLLCYNKGLLDTFNITKQNDKYNFPKPSEVAIAEIISKYPYEKSLQYYGSIAYMDNIPVDQIKTMHIYLDSETKISTSNITIEELNKIIS